MSKDIENSFMVIGAKFTGNDIPYCPTTAQILPPQIISYAEAKTIYNQSLKRGDKNFKVDAFVHFYIDDEKFDGKNGIWFNPQKALNILGHFKGIITPDFSTYADFPEPIKIWNTYRMRAFGYWYGRLLGKSVINNVRWGSSETYRYCFDGIEENSIVAVGTLASGLRKLNNREFFSTGFFKMIDVLKPNTIVIYGSNNYECFEKLRGKIKIVHFRSQMDIAFSAKKLVPQGENHV